MERPPEAEKKIAEATVAKIHADLGHSSVRQMIGALRTRKAHPSIVVAAKLYHCSVCFESERGRLCVCGTYMLLVRTSLAISSNGYIPR